jgi:hypothetical protein
MWVAPTHGETFSGFNLGPAYNMGWNLQWAGNCNVAGYWDAISKLEDRAKEVLKGKELSLYEDGQRPRGGYPTGCGEEATERVINQTKRFLDSRENASNNLKFSPTVYPNKSPKSPSTSKHDDLKTTLLKLKELEKEGLISKEDATRKRQEILDKL